MKKPIGVGLLTLFSFLFSLQPVFGQDSYVGRPNGTSFVGQVGIGGGAYYRDRCLDCGYFKRHDCGRHKGWKYRQYDDKYFYHRDKHHRGHWNYEGRY